MSRTAVALVALAVLICLGQWAWARLAAHVDLQLMPAQSRRRVRWLSTNSTHIQLAAAGLALVVVCEQAAAVLT